MYSRDLIEIMFEISKSLYDILEMRRRKKNNEEERLREYVLVELCPVIANEDIARILNEAKNEFKRKTRVNKIMIGKTKEVIEDTKRILRKVLLQNKYEVILEKTQGNNSKSSLETQTKDDTSSFLEVQIEVNVPEDARDKDVANKGEEEEEKVEDNQNPLVDTIEHLRRMQSCLRLI